MTLTEVVQTAIQKLQKALLNKNLKIDIVGNRIHRLILALWTHSWIPTTENIIGDPTICYLALSMIERGGEISHPRHTTPPISRLEHCMRLTFLVEMHTRVKQDNTCTFTQAEQELSVWYTEKNDSTFNTLKSLKHCATSIVLNSPGMPRVWWPDLVSFRVMYYEGNKVCFSDMPKLFALMEVDLVNIWEKSILLGLNIRTDYGEVMDNLSNNKLGYSFLDHPKNGFASQKDRLLLSILETPSLKSKFILDKLGQDGKPIWNIFALREWLKSYSDFQCIEMLRIEMAAGSPARGTEITSIQFCVTLSRQSRGLYFMGKYLAMLCQYHKGSATTEEDKVIPHALDSLSADLLIQDLTIARPFAEIAAYICFPNDKEMHYQYHNFLFVNNGNLFTTPQLSAKMKHYTEIGLDYGFTVSTWRHASASFRRKLCSRIDLLVEHDAGNSITVMQSAHAQKTENGVYGLTLDNFVTVSEDLLPRFLEASCDWQYECGIVPGGYPLPYTQVKCEHFIELCKEWKQSQDPNMPLIKAASAQITSDVVGALTPHLEKISSEKQVEDIAQQLKPVLRNMVQELVKEALSQPFFLLSCHIN